MHGIAVVLILVILIIIYAFFAVMISMGATGYNPSKIISEIFKKKSDKIENSLTKAPAPFSEKVTMDDSAKKIDEHPLNRSIMRWRMAAGILMGVSMLFFMTFGGVSGATPPVEIYPWIKYAFGPTLFVTLFVFIILWKKERGVVRDKVLQDDKEYQRIKNRVGSIGRIISGLSGFILLIITARFCMSVGFQGWGITIIFGGFSVLFLWIAISGKKPK